MRKRTTAGVALVALAALGLAVWVVGSPVPGAPGVLETSGRIEGDQAAVGAKVGGKIVRLAVREGALVRAGELMVALASEQVQAQLQQAEHLLHAAREQLGEAQARLESALRQAEGAEISVTLAERESGAGGGESKAAVGAARARLRQAEAARYRELYLKELIAAQQLDQAKAADEVAGAAVEAARKQVAQAEQGLALAHASRVVVDLRRNQAQAAAERVREAQAAVEAARARIQSAESGRRLAQANLADTRVTAPFGGTVLRKLVEPGEVTAAGTALVTLVDLTRLHAKVYVAEADLGKIKVGDPARVYTDAFPARHFAASVAEVSEQAEFTPRDVHMQAERVKLVFAVKLAIQNPEGILKPGMPVDARIRWTAGARWADGVD